MNPEHIVQRFVRVFREVPAAEGLTLLQTVVWQVLIDARGFYRTAGMRTVDITRQIRRDYSRIARPTRRAVRATLTVLEAAGTAERVIERIRTRTGTREHVAWREAQRG